MESYYTPCKEFDACNELIERYWKTGQYEQCFRGHLQLAEKGYPLAECQVGYFYLEGIGVQKNLEKAFYWTERAAQHGDRDAQFNLGWFYENGIVVPKDLKWAERWYVRAASQRQKEALEKIKKIKSAKQPGAKNSGPFSGADISNDGVDHPVMQHIVLGCDIYFLCHKFCVRVIILQGL